MNIQELIKEEQDLRNRLLKNIENQKELNLFDFVKKHGVNIGDTIEFHNGRMKVKAVISSIEFSGCFPSYYRANLFNTNGTISKKDTRIWNSEVASIKLLTKKPE